MNFVLLFFHVGFNNILNYIINYYSGVDTEVRDPRGFTALIKAGLQGREECVSALLMHGKQWWTLRRTFAAICSTILLHFKVNIFSPPL